MVRSTKVSRAMGSGVPARGAGLGCFTGTPLTLALLMTKALQWPRADPNPISEPNPNPNRLSDSYPALVR
eukprot:scaffold6968_cov46-Phaeocystis_antarctica.AAC.2